MKYVRCIKNTGVIYDEDGRLFDETIPDLIVGEVYKVAPPLENDEGMLRVIDASGEDYLYPAHYFEPMQPAAQGKRQRTITLHLDDFTRGVLHAEAVAAKKPMSALLREWVEERLDLPVGAD